MIISISNGGTVVLSYRLLIEKADDEIEFEMPVQNVPLASSIRLSLRRVGSSSSSPSTTTTTASRTPVASTKVPKVLVAPRETKKGRWGLLSEVERNSAVNLSLASLLFLFAVGRAALSLYETRSEELPLTSRLLAVGAENVVMMVLGVSLMLYNTRLLRKAMRSKEAALSSSSSSVTPTPSTVVIEAATRSAAVDVQLLLNGHSFTSPDAPIIEMDDGTALLSTTLLSSPLHYSPPLSSLLLSFLAEIPQRFIDGCEGDLVEARRRWDITRHWRETEGVTVPSPSLLSSSCWCFLKG